MESRICSNYLNEDSPGFVVEYRGDLMGQIAKVDYACGDAITDTLAVVSVRTQDLERLRKDVPAIIFIEVRSIYTLQEISPSDVGNIETIKVNPYLDLTGRGVVVGIIDTGINYLNQEFMKEDDTTRIIRIWDQSIQSDKNPELYIGTEYNKEEINNAIMAQKRGENPYDIVPSKDDNGHGTRMAGIVGARGYNGKMVGVANDCEFAIVKLFESPSYKKTLRDNELPLVPAYNNSEVLAAISYISNLAQELKRPMVLFLGVGTTMGSHDGYNITGRFITSLANSSRIIFVTGTGNLGASQGHANGFLTKSGEVKTVELVIPREIRSFELYIWVQKPDRMFLNIISPTGDETGYFVSQIFFNNKKTFYLLNTQVEVIENDPESFTGHQVFIVKFTNIKPGIWKFNLKADLVTIGRFDIWLPDEVLLPEGTVFLNPVDDNTLTLPSTARKVVSVSYYDDRTGAVLAETGKGFNTNGIINPDIATVGTNILTISKEGDRVVTVRGSSAASAIVAGACALILQWAIVDRNNISINSNRIRSLLIYGAQRELLGVYPNRDIGFGKLDLLGVFNVINGNYRGSYQGEYDSEDYDEFYLDNLYVRISKNIFTLHRSEVIHGDH